MAMQRPDMYHGVAFAADPNDPAAVPLWTAFDGANGYPTVLAWDRNQRGRQYELARTMGADPKLTFRDPNEYVNPANTSSPFYPYALPYRQSLTLATWPNSPGADDNLLNLDNWRVPCDPSFESYAVGSTPDFLTAYQGATAPTVTTTNPQAGTQCLTYDVATSSIRQGITYDAACVPGQQYTASAYVRQSSASTQIIRISDITQANDPFNRTTASGWGTAAAPLAAGGAWTATGGATGARSTVAATPYSSAYAQTAAAVVNTNYWDTLATASTDTRIRVRVTVPVVATGGEIQAGVVARWTSSGANCYEAVLIFGTDRSVILRIGKRVATVFTSLDTYTLPGLAYAAGDEFVIDFQVTGSTVRAAAWRVGSPAQDVTDGALASATDTSLTAAGGVGCFTWLHASNTNSLPVAVRFAQFSAVGAVEGTSTATTGSYVRLSVTFTATQPVHEVSLVTATGTSGVAGTVNVDSLMHNVGASAGTFQSTGSTIYPVMRPYVERWTRTWESAGFEGYSDVPCVDALAALAAIEVPPPLDGQIAQTGPDFWWRLDGGSGTTVYPDVSGNGGPALGLNISKYGIGTLPEGGAPMSIPGGGGVTGVTFTPPSPNTGSTQAATSLGTGVLADNRGAPFVLPGVLDGVNIWAVTVAMWVRAENSGAAQTAFYPSKQLSSTAGQAYIPCYVDIDGGTGTGYTNVGSTGTIHVLTSGDGLSGINLLDGEPHFLVGITVQDPSGDTAVYRYIDDVLDGTSTATTASLGGVLRGQTDSLSVGATDDGARFLAVVDGSITQLLVWNRELNGTELSMLYQAGLGHPGDTSGQRLARDLYDAGYTGQTRISNSSEVFTVADGDPITTMQAPSWVAPYSALADLLAITDAEQGCSWAAPDGAVVLEGRNDRFLRLESTWTFGEDEAGGEAPYLEGVTFDYDPAFVFSNVSVARPGGASARGGLAVDVTEAARRYFPRRYGLSIDVADDDQAQRTADWVFYSHRAPVMRVSEIELDPASNPALWPLVLGIEVGQRVTVRRRPKAANSGAGITMDADYFVETVTHHGVDYAAGTWRTTLLLSPIGEAPGVTVQPWILEDSALSVLDSTTVLGF